MCLQLQPKEHGHAVHQGKIRGQVRTPDSFATAAAALKDGHWGIKGHHTLNHRQGRRHSREMPCLWGDMLKGMWPVAVIWNGSHVSCTTARCMFVFGNISKFTEAKCHFGKGPMWTPLMMWHRPQAVCQHGSRKGKEKGGLLLPL